LILLSPTFRHHIGHGNTSCHRLSHVQAVFHIGGTVKAALFAPKAGIVSGFVSGTEDYDMTKAIGFTRFSTDISTVRIPFDIIKIAP
jgi:hypothetical protein